MNLFAFGSNGSGQLGIGHTEDVSTPTQCLFTPASTENQHNSVAQKDKIVQIVAGGNHTLLLTQKGHVYAAGYNSDGRCGPTHINSNEVKASSEQAEENILQFQRVILTDSTGTVDTFKSISATWEASILVADMSGQFNKVFVQGSAVKGELGIGEKTKAAAVTPGTSIPDFPPRGTTVSALASGMGHTVAILSNGQVYGWGGSRKGQLGEGLKGEKIVWSPTRIEAPFAATDAVCGREFTVLIGKREEGEFVVLGDKGNRWGVLDVNDSEALRVRIRGKGVGASVDSSGASASAMGGSELWRLKDIGASWHGIYAHVAPDDRSSPVAVESPLIAWGRNDRGQLPPSDLPALDKLAVGSEHVVALLQDGSVATFGWGEHGNCGPDTDLRGNVAGMYKIISLPDVMHVAGRVVGVGAGCATSWVIVD